MKKIILGILIISVSISAWTIKEQEKVGKHEITYYVKCDSGKSVHFLENTETHLFFPGRISSIEEAIQHSCLEGESKTTEKIITIKKGCEVFNNIDSILNSLTSNLNYSSISAMMQMGSKKYGSIIASNTNVSAIKYYPLHKISTDKHGNFKKNSNKGEYTKTIIDSYYHISDKNGKSAYVRKSCIE